MNNTPESLKTVKKNAPAFTLIELLVVVAIIAILAALLMPAANNALNSAKKTTAKNQAVQIATAITAYETEYGALPANNCANQTGTVDANMVNLLTSTNTRALSFIDTSAWKPGKGGTNGNGFCDPFNSNSVYKIGLDTTYANTLSNMPAQTNIGSAVTYTTTLTKHIGVWTVWTNGSKYNLIDSWD